MVGVIPIKYETTLPKALNCTAINPDAPIVPAIAVTNRTLLPYKSPIASAIETLPRNSPILGTKIKETIRNATLIPIVANES